MFSSLVEMVKMKDKDGFDLAETCVDLNIGMVVKEKFETTDKRQPETKAQFSDPKRFPQFKLPMDETVEVGVCYIENPSKFYICPYLVLVF